MERDTTIVRAAVVQMACGGSEQDNNDKAVRFIEQAAAEGANIILPPELFSLPYFPKDTPADNASWFAAAKPFEGHPLLERLSAKAAELSVVLPVSFFERAGEAFYNSIAVIDADGSVLGLYRKSHIPSGPGYEEKAWFSPGDTGFKVWSTRFGRIGVGICWDQWFPECARIMTRQGADILLYPTAIGSEPADPTLDTAPHWRRVMLGHAGANIIPVAAANRVGCEKGETCDISFYGTSFIADQYGQVMVEADRSEEVVLTADFDFEALRAKRKDWRLLSDRRPDLYGDLVEATRSNHSE